MASYRMRGCLLFVGALSALATSTALGQSVQGTASVGGGVDTEVPPPVVASVGPAVASAAEPAPAAQAAAAVAAPAERPWALLHRAYNTLDVGSLVAVTVTLPGGYEFHVPGYVHFVRDPMDMSDESEPGMGVKFEHLPSDSRELILRFVRKRAPMFYDD